MLLVWDLGISSLVLVVCLVFPVITLLIRRQWRLAVARREEIRRLLIFAQEEAARVEQEASIAHLYSTVSVPDDHHCAVCYCPTNTRCGRCKAVRYCSGKCQIIHWRQGHKDECHPPTTTCKTNDDKVDPDLNFQKKDQATTQRDKLEAGDWQHAEPPSVPSGEASDSTSCPEDIHDTIKLGLLVDKEESNSVAETSGSSFSGFSSSLSNDSSDDVSLCESISSFDSERLGALLGSDIAVEELETSFDSDSEAPAQPLSPKFTHLVESVNNFAISNKLHESNLRANGEEGLYRSGGLDAKVIRRHGRSVAHLPVSSSGFWEGSLERIKPLNDVHDDTALPLSSEDVDSHLSDSGSSVYVSSTLSEDVSPGYAKDRGVKNAQSDEAALENDKPSNRLNVSKASGAAICNSQSSHSSDSGEAKPPVTSVSSLLDLSYGTRGVSACKNALDVTYSSSLDYRQSNKIAKFPSLISYSLKTGKTKDLASKSSDLDIHSGAAEHSSSSIKSRKASNRETCDGVILHSTNSIDGKCGSMKSVLKDAGEFKNPVSFNHYPAVVRSEVAMKNGNKIIPGVLYESFIKLYNSKKGELQPCGIINIGNSCYANVVLQCLMFTPPLTAYFLQGFHSKACRKKEWCFICEFEKLVVKAKEGQTPLSPIRILSQLRNIGIQLGDGKEEDAHEFLRCAVDTMQTICLKEAGCDTSYIVEREETNLVGLTFGGYLRSKIKCLKCRGKSERHERMMDLTVEIEGSISTLEEALRGFTRTEILDGENKYKCGRCKSYQRAKKKLKILEPPNILTIALKRFQSGKFGKLNKSIRFPETLDLAPYVSGRGVKSHVYRLYGVVVHLDIMNAAFSGHYICYVKSSQNKWYKLDDSTVTGSDLDRVLTKGAYMLFYARCSPRPPRSICNQRTSSDHKIKTFVSKPLGKTTIPLSRSPSTNPSALHQVKPLNAQPTSIQTFYSKFHRLQRILEEDSSSESSSLFSNSDECSCSTGSTRDSSTSADEFADFIFGDLGGRCRNSPPPETHPEGTHSAQFLHSDDFKRPSRSSSCSSSNCTIADSGRPSGRAKLCQSADALRKTKSERT